MDSRGYRKTTRRYFSSSTPTLDVYAWWLNSTLSKWVFRMCIMWVPASSIYSMFDFCILFFSLNLTQFRTTSKLEHYTYFVAIIVMPSSGQHLRIGCRFAQNHYTCFASAPSELYLGRSKLSKTIKYISFY